MNEPYFEQVILDISILCKDLESRRKNIDNEKIEGAVTLSGISGLRERAKNRQELNKYLTDLSSTALNTICALMDFGRMYNGNVLPINLEKLFNKYYLPYWFDKNKSEEKSITASYLISKYTVLPRYLNRAKDLLFYSKHENISFVDDCGGFLYLDEVDGIVQVDYDCYELHLKCLKCNSNVVKIVDRSFLNKMV